MKQLAAIDEVFTNPHLLGGAFKDHSTWMAWFAFMRAFFGLPLNEAEKETYYECTGRAELPEGPHKEGWLVCGRRAGKSRALAFIAVYLSCFCDWTDHLSLGERGMLLVVATDRRQARVIFRYIPRPAYVRTRACRHDRARDGRNSRIVQRHFYRGCGCELPFHTRPDADRRAFR